MGDKEFVRACLDEYERYGFIYIRDVYDLLGEYEGNRDKYPDFESFYPEILEWMGAMAGSLSNRSEAAPSTKVI